MKRTTATFLLLSAMMSGAVLAQDVSTGVRESTDPAKADSVLRHAEEIRMKQDQAKTSDASAAGSTDQKVKKTTKKKGKSSAKKKSKSASSKQSSDGMGQDSMEE